MDRRRAAGALLALAVCIACSTAAPTASNATALDLYDGALEGCYYNFQHYGEGNRIMTNEPCLNCTCHNRMLMCYLRVCPFTKPIGQDCTVEKRADQCCPIVTCPDVPVDLLTSTSTSSPAEYGATAIEKQDKYGCSIDGRYFSEGSKVPPTPNKPCEHCYCIRNMTTCVMQECTLHVDGCVPIYHKDVCCPVRYSCDHPEDEISLLDDMTTTVRPTPGFLLTTTTLTPVTQVSQDCVHDDQIFADGALIKTEKACEHCYCMKGDIVCVVQECGTPMENEGKNCTSLPPRQGQCCPDTYICDGDELTTDQALELTTEIVKVTSTTPPRRGIEGSGYRNEPDEPYTDGPIFDSLEIEGSGEEQSTVSIDSSEKKISETQTPDLADEMFLTTAKEQESKTYSSTTEQDMIDIMVSKSEPSSSEQTLVSEYDVVTESTKEDIVEEEITNSQNQNADTTPSDVQDSKVTQEPLLTTSIEHVFASSSDLPANEDQYVKTTDASIKKEDEVSAVTEITNIQQNNTEMTTENYYYKPKETKDEGDHVSVMSTPVSYSNDDSILETTSVHTDIEEVFQSKQTTTDILTETSEIKKESTDESILTSTVKIESLETSSLSNEENEIGEDLSLITPTGRIPGEGDCLLNGITYTNNASVPTTNKCHTSCKCVNSIVTCDPIICSPPPEYTNMNNCQPMYDSSDSCCPTYVCDHLKETVLPESHSQMSGSESPKPSYGSECNGNECQVVEDKQSFELSQTTVSSNSNLPLDTKMPCDENAECQVTAVKPCEGDNCKKEFDVISTDETPSLEDKGSACKNGICIQTSSPKYDDDSLEKECNHDSCRRKESSDVPSKSPPSCSGQQCESLPEINEMLQELSSQLPVTSEEAIKLTTSSDYYTIKPIEKLTTLSEETLSSHVTATKIESKLHEFTTKQSEILTDVTDSGVTEETGPFTSVKPVVEKLPASDEILEISTAITATGNKQESITTSLLDISTKPSVSEEKTQILITTDTENEITIKPEKLSTTYPVSLETTSQEYTLSDDEKVTVVEPLDKHVTPVLNENKNIIDSYTTESFIHIKDTVKDSSELPSSTLTYNDEQATESKQSTNDYTLKQSFEPSTLLPEYHGVEEKLPEISTPEVTGKTELYTEATKMLDSSTIDSKDKYTTQGPKTSITTIDYEVTTEYIKKLENLGDQPTEQTPVHIMSESSSQINDIIFTEQNEISTTSVVPKYEGGDEDIGTKLYTTEKDVLIEIEKTQEELSTETPIVGVMESLNGRGTEIPSKDVNEELSTVTSQTNVEVQTTSASKISDFDESRTEIISTEKTKLTTQTNYEQERETKTSVVFDTEATKIVTNTPTFDTTESTYIKGEITTKVSKEDIDFDDKLATSIPEINTTIRLDEVNDNQKEADIDAKKDIELLSESTLKPEKFTERTAPIEISTIGSLITQSFSTEPSSLLTEHDSSDLDKIELSTPRFYPEVGTETITESSVDIIKQPHGQEEEEKYHLSTSSQISEFDVTPAMPVSTISPTSQDVLHDNLSQQEMLATVIDNLSMATLPTSSSTDMNKIITDSIGDEINTKLQETVTNTPYLTTKEFDTVQTLDQNKTTLTSLESENSYPKGETTQKYLISEDENNKKTTIPFESFTTEKSSESYINIVTAEVTGSPYDDDLKLKTNIPDFTTAKISVTEPETFTVKESSNKEIDHTENITEESVKTKIDQHHNEPITDSTEFNDKDEITEKTDLITPTKKTLLEISGTTDQILEVTEVPNTYITKEDFTEKSDYATLKTPEINESFEENTVNIGETETINKYTTESLVKITEVEYNNKIETITLDTPTTDEKEFKPVTDITLSPEIKYTEKNTEAPEKSEHTHDILTEAPEQSLKTTEDSAIKDSDSSTAEPNEAITMPEVYKEQTIFTTQSSNVHESEKDINLSEQKITENNVIAETTVRSTAKSTESYISDNEETSLPTFVNELTTNTPQSNEGVKDHEINAGEQKIPETSTETITQTSKFIDYTEETKRDKNYDEQTTETPEIATIISEIQKVSITPSYLPEITTDNITITESDEKHTEQSTEFQEISTFKFSENEDFSKNYITTESSESFTISKSPEELSIVDQTKTTIFSNSIVNEKTSESTSPGIYTFDKVTTIKTDLEQSTDLIQSTNYQTSSKPELADTISEDQLPITVKVNIDGDGKPLAYTTEQYTEIIEETSTDLQEDKTQKYAPTTHSPNEYVTTTVENYQIISQKYHDYTISPESLNTEKSESETQSPLTLSTEKHSYGQIDDMPDSNKYTTKPDDTGTTELLSSIITSRVEYSKPVTETKDEYTDTTPYLIELVEHTHKGTQEVTSEIYHELDISTVKDDTSFSEKGEDAISSEKPDHPSHESQTDSSIKENVPVSNEDVDVTTTSYLHDGIDILHTTRTTHEVSPQSSTQFEKFTTPSSLLIESENENHQTTSSLSEKDSTTFTPEGTKTIYEDEKKETPKQEELASVTEKENESDLEAHTPYDSVTSSIETTSSEDQLISALTNKTTTKSTGDATTLSPIQFEKFTRPEDKPTESIPPLSTSELHKPGFNEMLPTDDIPSTEEDNHFPPTGSSGYGQEPDYGEEDQAFGPGTCRYGGKVYVSAQQIPRDDPCDFCFCFRSDIICLQQSCPPPIHGCHEEPIQGFCCPRYECPVSMAMTLNITTTTTTTTTTLPPHFLPHAYKGAVQRRGCQIKGHTYKVGEVVRASSGPCLHCTCGGDGQMKCDPKACTPEPILRQMIAAAVSARRRR